MQQFRSYALANEIACSDGRQPELSQTTVTLAPSPRAAITPIS